jgi:hypothetical protein
MRQNRMKHLLNKLVTFHKNEEFNRRLDAYSRALKTEEWKFLRDTLFIMRSEMIQDMFSKKHTDLDDNEKDVTQRTYYNINQVLEFLLEPKKWIKRKTRLNVKPDLKASRKTSPK